ncbi:restriction endonuclease subunit S [Porphyromonas endodontalis]|uniref:restriction endonuclease subunit S n=1 Tax=Porphyromonas endodontalis TaxID=28124 RepID=UPI0023F3ED07|nr:restriction endonuclease subunit S [Porphyromonas endodontalis]
MDKKKPEIRFKGFEEEWVTTTLGECFQERVERSAEGELISVTINQGVIRASDLDRIDNSSDDKSNYKVVEVGDIAYNSMRMWQGACGYSLYKGICSPAYTVVIPQGNINVVYCFYMFKRNESLHLFRVNSQGLTSDTWNLKFPAFSQIKYNIPSVSEQEKIGTLLTTLDKLIAKLEAKLEKLRKLKQALLEKMFINVNEGSEMPEIRFKGYTDKWQVKELRDFFVVATERNQAGEYDKYDIYSVSREHGVINQIEYQGKSFAGASLANYGVVQSGDLVYTKSPLKSQPYGIIKTNEGQAGIVSALYGVYHPSEYVHSPFTQVYFELDCRLNDYLRPLVNKGAKNTLLISDGDSLKGKVAFPNKDEQRNIANLFKGNNLCMRKMELKLTKIRRIKESLLEKMFV